MKKQLYFCFFMLVFLLTHTLPSMAAPLTKSKQVSANCSYSVSNGWTQTINFKCQNNVNLNGSIIRFTVDNPSGLTNLNSVWGFTGIPNYPTNPTLTLNGNTATLALKFDADPVTLAAGTRTNFSYSTNNNVKVTGFTLYPPGTLNTGTINFSLASNSSPLPSDTIINVKGDTSGYSTSFSYSSQQSLTNIPYDTYQVTTTASQNGQSAIIKINPNTVTLSNTQPTQSVALSYISTSASLNLLLPTMQPSDVGSNTITVNVTDTNNHNFPVVVEWGGSATLSGLTAGNSYSISAITVTGQKNQYQFSFLPASFVAVAGQNNSSIGVQIVPIPTGTANVTILGLPADITTQLSFVPTSGSQPQVITFKNVQNGMKSYTLPAGYTYTVSAQPINANGKRYSVKPASITISANTTSTLNLMFVQTVALGVKGWPSYIAMGGVTDDSINTEMSYQSRPVDAIFKYGGLGGNGDLGQIVYPIFDEETVDQANALTNYYQQHNLPNIVKPVMVVYTANMSGGTNFTDFTFTNLVMHYINLIMETQKIQQYTTANNPYPGSIILNPDMFGMIQQVNLLAQLNSAISEVSLKNALSVAVCFATSTINTSYGNNLNYEQLHAAISKTVDPWTAMGIWNNFNMQYYNACLANPVIPTNITIPSFTNDFPGWVQSTNWLIRQFGPNVTFGWQENLWSIGSANWVHQNYTKADLVSKIANPTAALITASTAYSGAYPADFIVFDKYEMDEIPGAASIGYLFNARDWTNVLTYVQSISQTLGNVPVMLWQIPGGHLQVMNDIDTRNSNGSTSTDFIFGVQSNPLPNLKSYITAITLPTSIYGTSSIKDYLSMDTTGTTNNYTWQTNNMQQVANSNVFAILWGGGNTTSVSTFPTNDNGWLTNQIINYYKNPTPVTIAGVAYKKWKK